MSVKLKAITGIKWTTFASVINSTIQLIQLGILARLLDPTDFGLMAVVLVVIGFSKMFIDMGISNAIIYKQKITHKQLSSLYWLNIIIGIFLFIILVLLAPTISTFYNNDKLISLIDLVAISFLVKPWGQQFMILLQKLLKFNAIAKTDIISRIISFIVIIILAYNNWGVYSLAFGTLIYATCTTIGYILYGYKIHKPKFYFSILEIKEFINFGLFQIGEKIINYFSLQLDTILIGKLIGFDNLGLYSIAKDLVNKPYQIINPIVTKVTFPIMSIFNQNKRKLKNIFLKTVNYLSLINFPVYSLLIIFAKPLVILMFGVDWIEVIPIVQILSLTFLLRSIGNPSGSLLLSHGKANWAFYWNFIVFIFYPLSIYIGSYWDIIGIAWGTFILQLFLFFPNWKFIVNKICNATFMEYINTIFNPIIFSLTSIIIPSILLKYIDNNIVSLIVGLTTFSFVYLILLVKYYPKIIYEFFIYVLRIKENKFFNILQ